MNKLFTLFLFLLLCIAGRAQQILIYTETFENGPNSFVFDAPGVGSNSGKNDWTVNNLYNGQPQFPNTPSEDSTIAGTIYSAPYSHYLHVYSTADSAGGIANANWNNQNTSDRFCYTGSSFCTLGLTNVKLVFFWTCQGDSTGYGQVYYRANGGAWTATGQAKYYNQPKWAYESIQDPGFDNVQNVQIGFRWKNTVTADTNTVSFGVDDIIMVGTYDSINNPLKITCAALDSPICQGDPQVFYMDLSQPMCDGIYEVEMSNANGSFANPSNLGQLQLGPTFTNGYFSTLGTNGNLSGSCFKLRIVRTSPAPVVISDTSTCFSIIQCPNVIFNTSSVVMTDVDTTCILSELDVMFNSIGVFHGGNVYTAVLSDSNGNFVDSTILGTLPVTDSFPSMPQGDVSGLIPASVPAGCGYYIRVQSSNPYTLGPPIGPYCLAHCDELTNNHTDMHFCVASGPYPQCDTIVIHPHEWTNQAQYDSCNNWIIELRSMMDFSLVSSGGIGIYHDSVGGFFKLCMPSTADSLKVAPGSYYARIVSTCSNELWNQTGSVIRITIGAPSATAPTLTVADSVVCNTAEIIITANPFNHPPSDYQWSSNLLNNGLPFIWPYNPLYVTLNTNVPSDSYTFYIQEINFGCVGPFSDPAIVSVIGDPKVHITGPTTVCLGDTVDFQVTFLKETYYHWTVPTEVTPLITSNNEASMIFDTLGTFTIANNSINACGNESGNFKVKVISPYTVNAVAQPSVVCAGQPDTLTAVTNSRNLIFRLDSASTTGEQGAMFDIIAHDDVLIDSFAVKYLSNPAGGVFATIYGKKGSYITFEKNSPAWTQLASHPNLKPAPIGKLTVIPDEVAIPISKGDTFGFYISTANVSPIVKQATTPGIGAQTGVVYATDGVIDYVQGTQNQYAFGNFQGPKILDARIYYTTKAGMKFLWSNGDTTPITIFTPTQSGQYGIRVYDTSGCRTADSVTIVVNPSPVVNAGPDTSLCPSVTYVIPGISTSQQNINWQPATGLSSDTVLTPTFNYNQSSSYVLSASGSNGCVGHDTVNIHVKQIAVNAGPDTAICEGDVYVIPTTTSAPNVFWSPSSGLSSDTALNPTFSSPQGVTYMVSATDSNCTVSDTITLNITVCETYIQTADAFTPNGDTRNDHFTVFGKHIKEYEIRIFNRWGQEVYSFYDEHAVYLNDLNHGWDGTFKGVKEGIGTFAYYILAKDENEKPIQKKGNLSLIR